MPVCHSGVYTGSKGWVPSQLHDTFWYEPGLVLLLSLGLAHPVPSSTIIASPVLPLLAACCYGCLLSPPYCCCHLPATHQLPTSRHPRPTRRYEAIPPGQMAVPDLYLSMLATRGERLGAAFTAGRRLSTMANSTALC